MGFSKWVKKNVGTVAGAIVGGPVGGLAGHLLDRKFNKYRDDEASSEQLGPEHTVGTPEWLNRLMGEDKMLQDLMSGTSKPYDLERPELGTGFTERLLAAGQQQADIQARDISQSMAGRGGGIGSSLTLGAQARSQAATQGMAQGGALDLQQYTSDIDRYTSEFTVQEAERSQLLDALTFKYNLLNQIMGGHLGQEQTMLGYKGQREMAKAQKFAGAIPNVNVG